MLNERYMVNGKRKDGVTVCGHYVGDFFNDGSICLLHNDCSASPVDPETIEPVSVPISVSPPTTPGYAREYRCPNCNAWFDEIRRVGDTFYGSTPYCGNCGQRLDWSDTLEDSKQEE